MICSMEGRRITCRRFEGQVSDWLSRRLPLKRSEEMATHEKVCASCRRAVRAEAEIRRRFGEAAPSPALLDLWPRLAPRLEAEVPMTSPLRPFFLSRRWAMAAAVALVTLSACWNHLPGGISAERSRTTEAEKTLPAPALIASSPESSVPRQAAAWPQIGNAVQDDPAVDDPVGSNMENIWTCLNADRK